MSQKRKTHRYQSELKYAFKCYAHPNIRAKHPKSIEFTKDAEISLKADCIIGVRSCFDISEMMKFKDKILVIVECDGVTDEFHAIINPDFRDDREVVLRKGRFSSPRTFGIMLNKGADGLKREIAAKMREPGMEILVTVYQKPVTKIPAEQGSS